VRDAEAPGWHRLVDTAAPRAQSVDLTGARRDDGGGRVAVSPHGFCLWAGAPLPATLLGQ
jgi:hypothetical protein